MSFDFTVSCSSWWGYSITYTLTHTVLQCVAVCCSVLQCVVVCCSVLQCVAVIVLLLRMRSLFNEHSHRYCVENYCSVLQCAAACCILCLLLLLMRLHVNKHSHIKEPYKNKYEDMFPSRRRQYATYTHNSLFLPHTHTHTHTHNAHYYTSGHDMW